MKLVQLSNRPIFEQLRLEEALLRVGTGEWCLINCGSPPAIVMGISGKAEELIAPHNLLPVIRRFSGGGCVVIDEETLFITFIGDMPHPTPSKIHLYAESKLSPLFSHFPFALRENDYVLGDKKFGGNAQYIAKNRFLHHSSLLWTFNPDLMAVLQMPKKTPSYRQGRPHHDFLTTLEPHFPSKEAFFSTLKSSLSSVETPSIEELEQLLQTPHRQALSLEVAISKVT